MGETDKHRRLMNDIIEALTVFYSDRAGEVYVSGNNFVYWEEGNPKARVSPDCYVVFGPEMRLRDNYKAWEEGNALPSIVFEITSRKTQKEDLTRKHPLYERTLRVPEYVRFDPTGDYLKPRLQGYRLNPNGFYDLLLPVSGRLHSEQLGLDLVEQGESLRLFDPATGEFLKTPREEAAARRQAEAELARLQAEIEALRRGK